MLRRMWMFLWTPWRVLGAVRELKFLAPSVLSRSRCRPDAVRAALISAVSHPEMIARIVERMVTTLGGLQTYGDSVGATANAAAAALGAELRSHEPIPVDSRMVATPGGLQTSVDAEGSNAGDRRHRSRSRGHGHRHAHSRQS